MLPRGNATCAYSATRRCGRSDRSDWRSGAVSRETVVPVLRRGPDQRAAGFSPAVPEGQALRLAHNYGVTVSQRCGERSGSWISGAVADFLVSPAVPAIE